MLVFPETADVKGVLAGLGTASLAAIVEVPCSLQRSLGGNEADAASEFIG